MKVLIINGSPRINGNTSIAINEMAEIFHAEGIETDIVQVGNKAVRGCIACGQCAKNGKCVFDDVVNELAPQIRDSRRPGHCKPGVLCLCQCNPDRRAGPPVLQYAL